MPHALKKTSEPALSLVDPPESAPSRRLVTEAGAAAELSSGPTGEVLRVIDPAGAILFEYDAKAGKGTLRMPKGDLRLEALGGDIHMVAGGSVHCFAAGDVALQSGTSASVSVGHGGERSELRVDRGRLSLGANEIAASAKKADFRLDRATYVGEVVTFVVARAEQTYGELQVRAETLVESTGNVFRRVRELSELSAGRLRTLVEGAMRVQAGSVAMRAKDDVHIDGEHINLG